MRTPTIVVVHPIAPLTISVQNNGTTHTRKMTIEVGDAVGWIDNPMTRLELHHQSQFMKNNLTLLPFSKGYHKTKGIICLVTMRISGNTEINDHTREGSGDR